MSEIGDRVRELRKSPNIRLTLEDFGKKLGVGRAAISKIELGENNLTDQMKILICKNFHVNPVWLDTGEGEMFIRPSVEDEIAEMISQIQSDPDASFKRKLLTVLAGLSGEQWSLLADIAERLARPEAAAVMQNEKPEEEDSIEAKVEAYRRSLELEKEAKAKSEVS